MAKNRILQIDAKRLLQDVALMECNLYVDGCCYKMLISHSTYEEMIADKVFIRDGMTADSAGVLNTTNTFEEKDDEV
ncbi:hypothetical protein [Bacteroides sp.]|uniref:hypothetical protein n=1 Tax=Bacteroides sp. TaxID=29523 RepID=UPI00260F73F5|nr:hypothetical protein [Bacteroides sp.]MDD3037935.1 hypothetical protein [Bacteroides sp.]